MFDKDTVTAAISQWQTKLGLLDWDIRLSEELPDEGCRGTCDIFHNKKAALVRLDASMPPAAVDDVIVHELLHVLLSGMAEHAERGAKHGLPPLALALFNEQAQYEEEQAIQMLTVALVGHGLQDWSGDKWSKAFPVLGMSQ